MNENSINGFHNERIICNYLNGKYFGELYPNYMLFIEDLFGGVSDNSIIKSWIDYDKRKTDMVIEIGNIKKYVSIKKGICNSVHVEGISSFIHFLIDSGVSRDVVIKYLKYHYGDGSTNGSGGYRLSSSEYCEKYPQDIRDINEAFNSPYVLKRAINRFVLSGKNSSYEIDAVLYGTVNDIVWIKSSDVYKVIMNKISLECDSVHFAQLYCQPLMRCINRNPIYEKKRFCIQIKWYSIYDDIIGNMNNIYGKR